MALIDIPPANNCPTSWNDGMNWNDPDPNDWRYWYALMAAVQERYQVIFLPSSYATDAFNYPLKKGFAVREYAQIIYTYLSRLVDKFDNYGCFVDPDKAEVVIGDEGYLGWNADIITPKINYRTLAENEETRYWLDLPPPSSLANRYKAFMRSAKRALDTLRYFIDRTENYWNSLRAYGGSGDNGEGQRTLSGAIAIAKKDCQENMEEAYFGSRYNNHYISYQARLSTYFKDNVGESNDAYFGLVHQIHPSEEVTLPIPFKFGTVVLATDDTKIFYEKYFLNYEWSHPINMFELKEAEVTRLDYGVFPPGEQTSFFEMSYDNIPHSPSPPEGGWGRERTEVRFHGRVWFIADFFVDGGFRFRP